MYYLQNIGENEDLLSYPRVVIKKGKRGKSRIFPSGFSQGIQWARRVSLGPEELSQNAISKSWISYFLNCEKDLEALAEDYFSATPAEAEDNQLYVYSSDSSDETDQEIDSDVDFNFSECDLSERSKV